MEFSFYPVDTPLPHGLPIQDILQGTNVLDFIHEHLHTHASHLSPLQRLMAVVYLLDEHSFSIELCAVRPEKGIPLQHARVRVRPREDFQSAMQDWPLRSTGWQVLKTQDMPDDAVMELHQYGGMNRSWRRLVQPERCRYDLNTVLVGQARENAVRLALDGFRQWLKQPLAPELSIRIVAVHDAQHRKERVQVVRPWKDELSDEFLQAALHSQSLQTGWSSRMLFALGETQPGRPVVFFHVPTPAMLAQREEHALARHTPSPSRLGMGRRL